MSVGSELSPFQNRTPTYRARMPSDKSTVATKADFVPKVVGETDRDRSFSSVLAHDERSQQPRPEVHPEALNVLEQVQRPTAPAISGTFSCRAVDTLLYMYKFLQVESNYKKGQKVPPGPCFRVLSYPNCTSFWTCSAASCGLRLHQSAHLTITHILSRKSPHGG